MKMSLVLLLIILTCGCSPVTESPRILFQAEAIKLTQESGVITATYSYPSCIVPSETRHEVVATFEQTSSGKATGMVSVIGGVIAVIVRILTE